MEKHYLVNLRTKEFGKNIIYREKITSTNELAVALAEKGTAEGTVVVAGSQTKGRGRMGRKWESAPGMGLWFSIVLRPRIPIARLAAITAVTSVVVVSVIKKITGFQVEIKWPNDLVYQERKLAGILAEASVTKEKVKYLVLGIGININQDLTDFPEELVLKAISLRQITGMEIEPGMLLQEILTEFEPAYEEFMSNGPQKAIEFIRRNSATLGKHVRIAAGASGVISGQAVGLDEDGGLIIKVQEEMVRISSGELIEQIVKS